MSFVTFCHVLDTMGTIEVVYNELLHEDGGLFVANNINAKTLATADHDATAGGSRDGRLRDAGSSVARPRVRCACARRKA